MTGPERTVFLDPRPDVQLVGDTVMLKGLAALDVYNLALEGLAFTQRRARTDGIAPPARIAKALGALRAAAEEARQSPADIADIADVREGPTSPLLRSGERVAIGEVARMCGVGERQARRLAPSLGGVLTSRGWMFDRGLVQTYLDTEGIR